MAVTKFCSLSGPAGILVCLVIGIMTCLAQEDQAKAVTNFKDLFGGDLDSEEALGRLNQFNETRKQTKIGDYSVDYLLSAMDVTIDKCTPSKFRELKYCNEYYSSNYKGLHKYVDGCYQKFGRFCAENYRQYLNKEFKGYNSYLYLIMDLGKKNIMSKALSYTMISLSSWETKNTMRDNCKKLSGAMDFAESLEGANFKVVLSDYWRYCVGGCKKFGKHYPWTSRPEYVKSDGSVFM